MTLSGAPITATGRSAESWSGPEKLWKAGVGPVAAAFVLLELAMSGRYGFHRDELYFLACSRHMAWGYVDQPPFVPTVAWLATHLFGTSAPALRVFPALAGGATVVLSAVMARRLGGRKPAQLLAALAAATSPQVLAAFHLLSTASFDMFFWAVICDLVLRWLLGGDDRLWLAVGAVSGAALLNKFNVAFLLVSVAGGLLLAGRARDLVNRWTFAGIVVALAIWSPNIDWNARHHWAAVSMMHSLHNENSSVGASIGFIPSQLIVVGPAYPRSPPLGRPRSSGRWGTREGATLKSLLVKSTNYHIYGPSPSPVEQINTATGTPDWYVNDQIGSTRALLDTSGNTAATYTYDPYGNTTNTSGTPGLTSLRWQGQYQDPNTGLYYMRARWYDPQSGQFLDADPLLAATHQPYSYAGGDPINSADPSGLMHCPFLAGCSFSAAFKRTTGWFDRLSPCQQSEYIDWQQERTTVYQSIAANQAALDALEAQDRQQRRWVWMAGHRPVGKRRCITSCGWSRHRRACNCSYPWG
ncbi:MAG: glycosyltransferase family 39 protein [Actinomycetota bacterium]|nr:glycosyltransferase family 39 protein [Actinomycetota bacterium]